MAVPDETAVNGREITPSSGQRRSQALRPDGSPITRIDDEAMEIVKEAISGLDSPSATEIVEYATQRGVSEGKAQHLIDKLYNAGQIIESGRGYEFV